jgi:hypothetical protein
MNIRHISIFNEFLFEAVDSGSGTYNYQLDRNINCISLNQSSNYAIKNLSIDIGANTLESNNIYNVVTAPAFPLRFFLSENPINDCISSSYTTTALLLNGVSAPSTYETKQNDRLDSSNQSAYISPIVYSNYLQLTQESTTLDYNYTRLKTYTIAEMNFFNFNQIYTLQSPGTSALYSSIITNNDCNDFQFFSNNESNLSMAIFPKIRIQKAIYTNALLRLRLNYTINFDLIEDAY